MYSFLFMIDHWSRFFDKNKALEKKRKKRGKKEKRGVNMGVFESIIEVWGESQQKGWLSIGKRDYAVKWGRSGITEAKKEGDGATPAGLFALRRVLYRADRSAGARPQTGLPAAPLKPDDGWCDAPDDPKYNQQVPLPYPAHAERLWRKDGLYDIIIVIGFNDDPVRAGLGSAIFIHLAAPDNAPTQGCIALMPDDMRALLKVADAQTKIRIRAAATGETEEARQK